MRIGVCPCFAFLAQHAPDPIRKVGGRAVLDAEKDQFLIERAHDMVLHGIED